MSTVVDNRVVEMRFDNRDFENNVQRSMGTLERLKASLNLSKSTGGFDDVGKAASRLNFSGLGNAIENVRTRFSALEVMGVTALVNITNSAVNAGKKLASAFTIEPIKTGLEEYETQINAVQTILANTQSKGSTLQDVNRALDELNTYADKTIYNFTEMTRNIGTFTAAGLSLETSTSAIQGIANLAAVSGSTSQQASTAMYQLSQALSAGALKLQDWNSVVNAGMGGQVFQDALKATSKHMVEVAKDVSKMSDAEQKAWQKSRGYTDDQMDRVKKYAFNVDELIQKYGSYRESLQTGWITSEVLSETLQKMTKTGVAEYLSDVTGIEYEQIEAVQNLVAKNESGAESYDKIAAALAKTGKITEEEAKDLLKMADTAEDAATKVKTFSQLMDTLKEAAQSGWTQSWETIVGDFDEAKELYTEISDTLGDVIGKSSDTRNQLLTSGLSSGWKQFLNLGINDVNGFKDTLTAVAKDNGVAVDKIVEKNGTLEKSFKDGWLTGDILAKSVDNMTKKLKGMSSEELKNAGYTNQDVAELSKLNKAIKKGTVDTEAFAKAMSKSSGRENLIQSLRNSFEALGSIMTPIREAFREVFPPMTGEQLYAITEKVEAFTEKLKLSDTRMANLKTTFKGFFSIFDIFKKSIAAFVKPIAGLFGSDGFGSLTDRVLESGAALGQFFVSLDEDFTAKGISGAMDKIASTLSERLSFITDKIRGFGGELPSVSNGILDSISSIWSGAKKVFSFIFDNISTGDVFLGLTGGGIFAVAKKISELASSLKDTSEDLFEDGIFAAVFGKKAGVSNIADNFADVMGGIHDSLESFSAGLKVSSIIGVAIAVGILASSLKKVSDIDIRDLTKAIWAIGSTMAMLTLTFKSMNKSIAFFNSDGIVKSAFSMILVAKAVDILAGAVSKFGALPLKELTKGLTGAGIGLAELTLGIKAMDQVKVSIRTSIAMLALAESCKLLGDAMAKFSGLSWSEIGRGLVAMGGALGEFVATLSIFSKVGGGGSLMGSISLLIAVQALDKLAAGLAKFGQFNWDEIGRGLTAMGGALAEVSAACAIVGSIAGFSGIFGAGAIDIVTLGLGKLADALQKFGTASWGEIARGLTAMGGALTEVSAACTIVGAVAGFSGIFGAGAIDIVIAGLDKLSTSFAKFGSMSWDEIGRGLVAMGGAIGEVSAACTIVGAIAGVSGVFGAGAIDVVIAGLDTLASALIKFGSMSWSEIGRGLTAMGGALTEVSAACIAVGDLAGFAGILGGESIKIVSGGLGDIADALQKLGSMNWGEIGRGLAAMAGALVEVAAGGFLNTLSILGSVSISNVAKPLGELADSLRNWEGVDIPKGLGLKLAELALGIAPFTGDLLAGLSVRASAKPLGDLADSVKKWEGVTVPAGIGDNLSKLANGVEAFSFAFMGGWSLSTLAAPLGDLADSMKKWSDVHMPYGIADYLTNISDGIKSFSWAFAGGWSMAAIVGPLGELPDALSKWKGVIIPAGLSDRLKDISEGVKSFTWLFTAGWSIDAIVQPLSDLVSVASKLGKVNISDGSGDKLKKFADDISAFASKLQSVASVNVANLLALSDAVGALNGAVGKITGVDTNKVEAFVESISKLGKIDIDTGSVSSASKEVADLVNKMMESVNHSIFNSKSAMYGSMKNAMSGASSSVRDSIGQINNAINAVISGLIGTVDAKKSVVTASFKSLVSGSSRAISSNRPAFVQAGLYLGDGLVVGINSKQAAAYQAGYRLGQMAVQGEKAGQQSHSPSKATIKAGKWLGEGLVIGMNAMRKSVYDAGNYMGELASAGISSVADTAYDLASYELDLNPTVRPVLDLSDVKSGANAITGILGAGYSVGTMAYASSIGSMMNSRHQNGTTDDVISAINLLRRDLGNVGNTTYNVNGVTYDDGSNISDAVKSLIRAARVERRM